MDLEIESEKKYLIWENGRDYSTEHLKKIYSSILEIKKSAKINGRTIKQGFLPIGSGMELANKLGLSINFKPNVARLRKEGNKKWKFYFTLKAKGHASRDTSGDKEITSKLFNQYWGQTKGKRVDKVRLKIPYNGYKLEIDVFTGRDLILAEIEAPEEDLANLLPPGIDVTEKPKYKNVNLAR